MQNWTAFDYQMYFNKVFAKAIDEDLRNNADDPAYTREYARQAALKHFRNDSTDYDAVVGMYINDAIGDKTAALNTFMETIHENVSDRNTDILAAFQNVRSYWKAGERFHVSGNPEELHLEDYDVRVCTDGTIEEDETPGMTAIYCTVDTIDNDCNIGVHLPVSMLRPAV